MATFLGKLGFWLQEYGDKNWHERLNTGLQNAEGRFGKNWEGDPNGHVASEFLGQICMDTVNKTPYFSTKTGTSAAAIWVNTGTDMAGDIKGTMVDQAQPGWLRLNGSTYPAADYPKLAAARPDWVTGANLTLPNCTDGSFPVWSTTNLGVVVGSSWETSLAGARDAGVTGDTTLDGFQVASDQYGGGDLIGLDVNGTDDNVGADPHHHTVPAIPSHKHTIDPKRFGVLWYVKT